MIHWSVASGRHPLRVKTFRNMWERSFLLIKNYFFLIFFWFKMTMKDS